MKIHYRVISVDEKEKSFVIRYFTDMTTEKDLANQLDIDGDIIYNSNGFPLRCRTDYNISITNESDSTIENVTNLILSSAPVQWLSTMDNVASQKSFSMSNVTALLNNTNSFDSDDLLKTVDDSDLIKQAIDQAIDEAVKHHLKSNNII